MRYILMNLWTIWHQGILDEGQRKNAIYSVTEWFHPLTTNLWLGFNLAIPDIFISSSGISVLEYHAQQSSRTHQGKRQARTVS